MSQLLSHQEGEESYSFTACERHLASSHVRTSRVPFFNPRRYSHRKRNKLYPATTKMLAVVKDMVKKIRADDIELSVDSDDESFVDDAELSSQITQELNESGDVEMEVDSNENNSVCILLDE